MSNFTQMMVSQGKSLLYNSEFIRTLCSYFPNFIRNNVGFETIEVAPTEALRYKGDLRGLLLHRGISADLIYPTMLFNGIYNSYEYDGIQTSFNILKREEVDKVMKAFNVSQKIGL